MADATTTDQKPLSEQLRSLADYAALAPRAIDTDSPLYRDMVRYLREAADALAALLSASQPSAPVDPPKAPEDSDVVRVVPPFQHPGYVITWAKPRIDPAFEREYLESEEYALLQRAEKAEADVTALHAERDRLAERVQDLERVAAQESSVYRRNVARLVEAEAEAARLRAALEEIANMDRVDGEEGQPMHTAAAALASSGTVPEARERP